MARRALYDNIYEEISSAVPEGSRDSEALLREAEEMDADAIEIGGWGARQNKRVRLVEDKTEVSISAPAQASKLSSRTAYGNPHLRPQSDEVHTATSSVGELGGTEGAGHVGDDDDNALLDAAKESVESYILTEEERKKRYVVYFYYFIHFFPFFMIYFFYWWYCY